MPHWCGIAFLYFSGCSRLGREASFASVSWCPDGVKKRGLEHKAYFLAPARSPNSQEVNAKLKAVWAYVRTCWHSPKGRVNK